MLSFSYLPGMLPAGYLNITARIFSVKKRNEEATEETIAEELPEEEITEEESTEEAQQLEEDEMQQVNTVSTELNVVISEVGYLIRRQDVLHPYAAVQYIGDTDTNNPCRGYISYDISSLSGATIQSAAFELGPPYERYGNTSMFFPISLYAVSWGGKGHNTE